MEPYEWTHSFKLSEPPLEAGVFVTQKEPVSYETGSLAGAEGLEPSTKVLETHVLPLHHAPKHLHSISRKF